MRVCDLCGKYQHTKGCPNYDIDLEGYILCPSCGSKLHNQDVWYPDLDVCEFCLKEHEKEISMDDIENDE